MLCHLGDIMLVQVKRGAQILHLKSKTVRVEAGVDIRNASTFTNALPSEMQITIHKCIDIRSANARKTQHQQLYCMQCIHSEFTTICQFY